MATKIGFRCQIDNITHRGIINYLNINCSIMSQKKGGVMKEVLLETGIILLMVWTFQILVLLLRLFYFEGFTAVSCIGPVLGLC